MATRRQPRGDTNMAPGAEAPGGAWGRPAPAGARLSFYMVLRPLVKSALCSLMSPQHCTVPSHILVVSPYVPTALCCPLTHRHGVPTCPICLMPSTQCPLMAPWPCTVPDRFPHIPTALHCPLMSSWRPLTSQLPCTVPSHVPTVSPHIPTASCCPLTHPHCVPLTATNKT